jgi:hypothetical protein
MPSTTDRDPVGGAGADEPQAGCAEAGAQFTPADVPDADVPDAEVPENDAKPAERREAPAPGVPVSEAEFDRLKDRARHHPRSDDAPAQEDAPNPS